MRTFQLPVRITRTKKCKEGFYLLVNGSRIRHPNKATALAALRAILSMQRIQLLTVREFAEAKKHRVKVSSPPAQASAWEQSSRVAWTSWPRSGPGPATAIEQLELWPQLGDCWRQCR